MKNAKAWFQANPTCKVIHHRRWSELSAASRERLSMPRTVKIRGTRAVFSDGSELPLKTDNWTSLTTPGGLLDVYASDGIIQVTYAKA